MLTVRLYAERKQWSLDRIEVRLTREPEQGKISSIALELILGGDLDDEQRAHGAGGRNPRPGGDRQLRASGARWPTAPAPRRVPRARGGDPRAQPAGACTIFTVSASVR